MKLKYMYTMLFSLALSIGAMAQVYPGMAAPELKVGFWVKGSPVESFEKGRIYVVEFWATWCGPCIGMIPELSKLAKKYRGKVTVIGVSVAESNTDKVRPFVAQMGKKMDYHVAIDAQDSPTSRTGFMAENWLWAGGMTGIPAAFIVGRTGNIEYIGGSAGLEGILTQILAGSWDAGTYAATVPKLRATGEQYVLRKSLAADLRSGAQAAYYRKLEVGFQRWSSAGYWGLVNEFIFSQLAEAGNKRELQAAMRDYGFGIRWMKLAVDASPTEAGFHDTLGWLYYRSGDKKLAMESEQRAIALLASESPNRALYEKTLQTFKQ